MLDTETKRRIDAARDILVGKVPDPKSQVEQITIALIYKFMDDMDAQAEELGGTRAFFAGEFEKYSWAKLMRVGSSGYEILNLYAEAITRMTQNANLPSLFREIFKNAYLPYRDPETLKQFLKIINEFAYDHSERLGDAFEYLLAVLGSQGDAGQFRTPRHIIDFMVALLDPQKNEALLDPACGTAGFLISAYKHIWHANARDGRPGAALTPAERARLVRNIKGYDISPDMVRLSLVNLYLHGFAEPHIVEYDTLTSDDRWNEHADLIMANPPFMSPKGGIRPHKRFSVQSNRSEVLFVDYIAEHLTANGRAAVIVPEGIIFQSGKAYKALRKMLVEKYLVGVISLPAGVFNPYSGVKTSILWLDKTLAKKTDEIIFAKIENDGFDLGAQRRESKQNDLPDALKNLQRYKRALSSGEKFVAAEISNFSLVGKARLAENGDYNLSGERYKANPQRYSSKFEFVEIGKICELINGTAFKPTDWETKEQGGLPIVRIQNLNDPTSEFNYFSGELNDKFYIENGELLFSWSGSRGTSFGAHIWTGGKAILNQHIFKVKFDENEANKKYLYYALNEAVSEVEENLHGGVGLVHITKGNLERIKIPLPPLAVQQEIVAEIEGYQKIIEGARQVVENYQPRIEIEPEWEMVRLGDAFEKVAASVLPADIEKEKVIYVGLENISQGTGELVGEIETNPHEIKSAKTLFQIGDILYGKLRPNLNKVLYANLSGICSTDILVLRSDGKRTNSKFYAHYFLLSQFNSQVLRGVKGAQLPRVGFEYFSTIQIPLPNLATQQRIVTRIEREQALVQANRELISLFEEKIRARIARVWGEA